MKAMLLSVSLLSTSISQAQQSLHKGYWQQITPTGKTYKCQIVRSHSQMIDVLRKAGWSMNRTPLIDWEKQSVVIIAPDKTYNNSTLSLYGLKIIDGELNLEYGWSAVSGVRISEGMADSSSGSSANYETMVVSFEDIIYDGRRFFCVNLGPN